MKKKQKEKNRKNTLQDVIHDKFMKNKVTGLNAEEKKRLFDLRKILAGKSREQKVPDTAQKTIPFIRMYTDGICHVNKNFYTKMIEFTDINYNILAEEDQINIQEIYGEFLNYFDPTVRFQIFLFNREVNADTLMEQFNITSQGDDFDDCREEFAEMLKNVAANGNVSVSNNLKRNFSRYPFVNSLFSTHI